MTLKAAGAAAAGEEGLPNTLTAARAPLLGVAPAATPKLAGPPSEEAAVGVAPHAGDGGGAALPNAGVAALGAEDGLPKPAGAEALPNPEGAEAGLPNNEGEGEAAKAPGAPVRSVKIERAHDTPVAHALTQGKASNEPHIT